MTASVHMSKSLEKQLALTGASTDVNSVFSLHALTAIKMLRQRKIRCCRAAGKPAIRAERSIDQWPNLQTAGQCSDVQVQPVLTQHLLVVAARNIGQRSIFTKATVQTDKVRRIPN
jgi:hypothetical protein